MTGFSPITVRRWITRGHVRRNRHGKIDGAQVITYIVKRGLRGQHAHRRARLDALLKDLHHLTSE